MPKVRASMADVSTEFKNIEPGVYRVQIKSITEEKHSSNPDRYRYDYEHEIVEDMDGGNEDMVGETVKGSIHIHKKTGEVNEYGVAELKRLFEVTLGEDRANAEDADTDELIGQQMLVEIGIESWESVNKLTKESETRKASRVKNIAPVV